MSLANQIIALDAEHVLQVYRRPPIVFARGEGCWLYDLEGQAYLDLISGVGVASLGHAHPRLVSALAAQAATLAHTSNLYHHPLQSELAARLAALSGLPRAFFCNSGTEAVEACLKFVRRYWHSRGEQRRTEIVALEGAFHGRTCGSLSVTWDEHYRTPFQPLLPDITFVPADPGRLLDAISDRTAAVIIEPIQGEGGVRPLSSACAAALRSATARSGALLIADEIQCGLGRTGQPFCFQALGLQPDLVAVGKALGAGVPVGAALASQAVASAVAPGDHGSTYGGNLLACRAALVFLEELVDRDLIGQVRRTGAHFEERLRGLARRHPIVAELRGAGLMWGLELTSDATPFVEAALRQGLLINRTAGTVLRFLPALVIAEDDIDRAMDILEFVLSEATVTA